MHRGTILFQASVEAQGGAYATGVLVLMSSAAFAVTLAQVGKYRILRAQAAAVPNAIAAILFHIRDYMGQLPYAYFGWIEGNPVQYLLRFMLFGEGNIAVVTREVIRKAEPSPIAVPIFMWVGKT